MRSNRRSERNDNVFGAQSMKRASYNGCKLPKSKAGDSSTKTEPKFQAAEGSHGAKGTTCRQGIRAPQWTGGGVTEAKAGAIDSPLIKSFAECIICPYIKSCETIWLSKILIRIKQKNLNILAKFNAENALSDSGKE